MRGSRLRSLGTRVQATDPLRLELSASYKYRNIITYTAAFMVC